MKLLLQPAENKVQSRQRSFYTRPRNTYSRWRLRSTTQRLLSLSLSFIGLAALVWLTLPVQDELTLSGTAFWLEQLGINARVSLHASNIAGIQFTLPAISAPLPTVSTIGLILHLASLPMLVALRRKIAIKHNSLGWVLGLLCTIHGLGILGLCFGATAPLSISQHTLALSLGARVLLLLSPFFLVFGLFLLEPDWPRRITGCLLLLGFLTLAQPIKQVAHVVLIQTISPLLMPSLFLLFGPAFDVLAIAGILSAILSRPPKQQAITYVN